MSPTDIGWTQLVRIGYDDLRGTVLGNVAQWREAGLPVSHVPVVAAAELQEQLERGTAPLVLDVRHHQEWRAGHLPHAFHLDAGHLPTTQPPVPKNETLVVHCGEADRSTVGISLLERQGYHALRLLGGGYKGWRAAGYPILREASL